MSAFMIQKLSDIFHFLEPCKFMQERHHSSAGCRGMRL